MAKRVNPRSRPRSQADCERAWSAGADFGAEFCLNLILLVLKDKHGACDDDILQLRDEFMQQIDSYNRGYISYPDIKRTLYGEYDFTVHLSERGTK